MNGAHRLAGMLALALPASVACPSSTASFPEVAPRVQLVNDLSVFAQGAPLPDDDASKRVAELSSGGLSYEAFIDNLLAKPMSGRIARDIVISPSENRKDRHPIPLHSLLRSAETNGERRYFLREKCEAADAVRVRPWWSRDQDVLVCADAYRPEVKGDSSGRTCGASMLAPRESDVCGCGPHLMYCTSSEDQFRELQDNLQREVWDTTAWVVNKDLPIEELFTMNASVRNEQAEMLYRRARIGAGEPDTLLPVADFPAGAKGELRPRVEQAPGQHAGVLSMPALVYSSDALRGVMRNYYDYLWCAGVASSRVSTEGILALDIVDLRVGDGWQKLAAMDVCTDCHARLDYGMQFFRGFPSSTMGLDFRPGEVLKGSGPLYGHNIKDERGTAELTPQGFAKLAVAQPEFGKCMAKKVIDHVFNGSERAEDFKAVHETFTSTHRFKAMLRTAMLRYAERNKDGPIALPEAKAPDAAVAAVDPDSAGDKVVLSSELRALLDDKCMSCHDKDDPYDFNGRALPRLTLVAMMDQVGFGAMPKTVQGLDDDERKALVRALGPLAFPVAAERTTAIDYFANGMRGKAVHRWRAAMGNVNLRAGGKGEGFRPSAIEADIEQSLSVYTPGVAVSAGVAALRDCKAAKHTGPALEACVQRSSAPGAVIVGAVIDK